MGGQWTGWSGWLGFELIGQTGEGIGPDAGRVGHVGRTVRPGGSDSPVPFGLLLGRLLAGLRGKEGKWATAGPAEREREGGGPALFGPGWGGEKRE